MLNPESDRLDYGELLTPPEDYELDFALATTYSLDLDTLVGVSLALGLCEDSESNDKIHILEALKTTGDKIAIFCESAQIKLPNKVTPLYCLLEKMVFQISLSKTRSAKDKSYPAFHPKIWLIKFTNGKRTIYRFIILSRNLTFDRSWDVSFVFDGIIGKKTEKNKPLQDFCTYLASNLPTTAIGEKKRKCIYKIIDELNHVSFSLKSEADQDSSFNDFNFLPNLIENNCKISESELFTTEFDKLIIISPFLTAEIVGEFNKRQIGAENDKNCWLFTRKEEFLKIPKSKRNLFSHFHIYTLNETIEDGEHALFSEGILQQKIHAKYYILQKRDRLEVYLGSFNCSRKAKECNCEFLIQLFSTDISLFESVISDFTKSDENSSPLFVELSTDELLDEPKVNEELSDLFLKDITRLGISGIACKNTDGNYNIHFCIDKQSNVYAIVRENFQYLFIRNLTYIDNKEKNVQINDEFNLINIKIQELSEFFIVSYIPNKDSAVTRIIKIPISGIPEDRDDYAISSIIENTDGFIKYLSLILEDDSIISSFEAALIDKKNQGSGVGNSIIFAGLYERFLKMVASDSSKTKILKIENLLSSIKKEDIIPEGFTDFFTTFKHAIGQ